MTLRPLFLALLLSLAAPCIASAQTDAATGPTTREGPPEGAPSVAPASETPTDPAPTATPTATVEPVIPPPPPPPPASAVPPPPEAPATTPAPTEPQAPTTPTPSATGAASANPVTAVVAGIPIRVTGIVHASVYGSQAVQSFGNATSVAPTSALNPALLGSQADQPVLSFQVQQSRFGLTLGEGTPFRGIAEIDFVHFDQSSPVAQAFPRIRILQLEWHPDEHHRIFVGQGWDIFGNAIGPQLLSHSANLVGTMFQAGNIGFMRQQLGWEGRFGDVAVALAVGMQGSNTGPTFNNLEESFTPTGAARVMVYVASNSVVGVSGLATAPRFTDAPTGTDVRTAAYGGELFADVTFGSLNLHAEAYVTQNLANTGALNLAQGWLQCTGMGATRSCALRDVADAGGYLSARLNLGEWSITAMAGFAGVLRPSEVAPGYTSAAAATPAHIVASPATAVGTASPGAGPGMVWNASGHVGVWFSPMRGLSFVLEPYFYFTRFVMDTNVPNDATGVPNGPSDAQRYGAEAERFAAGGQFTTMFQF
ncbi:MAG: hypothetical protein U0234_09305 [Sandaracinus sp.]